LNNTNDFGSSSKQEEIETHLSESLPMGRAIIPFHLFEKRVTIYDEEDNPIYEIVSSNLQCQNCLFSLPYGPCQESVFYIVKYKQNLAVPLGYIYKRWSECFKMCCASAAYYIIDFPDKIDWKRKLLIISGVQLIDQFYFNGFAQ
jgi:hypothetical protein